MNDDLKLDKDGNIALTDPQESMEYIRKQLLDRFQYYVGQPVNSKVSKDIIAKTMETALSSTSGIESCDSLKVKTRWENMGIKGRLEWRFYRLFFKDKVTEMQEMVNFYNGLVGEFALATEDEEDRNCRFSKRIDYPNWCHPNPKSVIDVSTTIKFCQPIDFIMLDTEISK